MDVLTDALDDRVEVGAVHLQRRDRVCSASVTGLGLEVNPSGPSAKEEKVCSREARGVATLGGRLRGAEEGSAVSVCVVLQGAAQGGGFSVARR